MLEYGNTLQLEGGKNSKSETSTPSFCVFSRLILVSASKGRLEILQLASPGQRNAPVASARVIFRCVGRIRRCRIPRLRSLQDHGRWVGCGETDKPVPTLEERSEACPHSARGERACVVIKILDRPFPRVWIRPGGVCHVIRNFFLPLVTGKNGDKKGRIDDSEKKYKKRESKKGKEK